MIKKVLVALLAVLVLMQVFQIDKTNPTHDLKLDFVTIMNPPENVQEVLTNKCYDCHSHTTKYPWYTYIQPVGWWIEHHIEEGREHLNYSEWGTYEDAKAEHKLEESYEEVEEGEMPLASYTWIHGGLNEEESELLVNWFKDVYNSYDLQSLADEVMDIHDQVMPKMADLAEVRLTLSELDGNEEILATIELIAEAEEAMLEWMRQYDPTYAGSDRDVYLSNQKAAIQDVSDQMLEALNKGKVLAGN